MTEKRRSFKGEMGFLHLNEKYKMKQSLKEQKVFKGKGNRSLKSILEKSKTFNCNISEKSLDNSPALLE